MHTRTRPNTRTTDSTWRIFLFDSRAWKRPSQLRIRNPNRIRPISLSATPPDFVPRSPLRGLCPYLPPTTQTPRPRHNPNLDPRSKGHSIDAIPSCREFGAYQFPYLRRVDAGTEQGEKRVHTIQCNANPPSAAVVWRRPRGGGGRDSPSPLPAGLRGLVLRRGGG